MRKKMSHLKKQQEWARTCRQEGIFIPTHHQSNLHFSSDLRRFNFGCNCQLCCISPSGQMGPWQFCLLPPEHSIPLSAWYICNTLNRKLAFRRKPILLSPFSTYTKVYVNIPFILRKNLSSLFIMLPQYELPSVSSLCWAIVYFIALINTCIYMFDDLFRATASTRIQATWRWDFVSFVHYHISSA